MDAIPVFSQVKSLVQWLCRDSEGALHTQENFSRQCPVVSQIRSAVESAKGDNAAALETQQQCLRFLLSIVDGIPVIGHVKGGVHYALKDKERGDAAMKAASHTSAVIGGGVGGFLIGGPVGSVAGGIASGFAIDSTITAADSLVHKNFKPYGLYDPISDPTNPGKWCDAVGGMVIDGITGRAAGKVVQQIKAKNVPKDSTIIKAAESTVYEKLLPLLVETVKNKLIVQVRIMGDKIVFEAQKLCEKKLSEVLSSDVNRSLPTEHDEKAQFNEKDVENLRISITENGDAIEIHHCGKLILYIMKGQTVFFMDADRSLERAKIGCTYISKNGYCEEEPECTSKAERQMEVPIFDEEDGLQFDPKLVVDKVVFSYDLRKKKIVFDNEIEEEQSDLSNPSTRRLLTNQ